MLVWSNLLTLLVVALWSARASHRTSKPTRRLLQAISESRRPGSGVSPTQQKAEIVEAVRSLELLDCGRDKIEGNWNLVWSGKSSGSASPRDSVPALQFLSDRLYALFFQFAPQLAGSNSDNQSNTRNEQLIDLSKRSIINKVEIKNLVPVTIVVEGTCSVAREDPSLVNVVFIKSSINGIVIPLPRPKGTLRTVFNDGSVRISIGGQGGIFVCKKI